MLNRLTFPEWSMSFHSNSLQAFRHDWAMVGEVILNDGYNIRGMPKTAAGAEVVVDVGAHIGTFLTRMRMVNKTFAYYGFEPCVETYEILKSNAAGENDIACNAAIDYGGAPKVLLNSDKSGDSTGNAVIDRWQVEHGNYDSGRFWVDERPLDVRTLSDVLQFFRLRKIDILKLDCEGAECRILENDREAMEKVRHVVGEWHGGERFFAAIEAQYSDWELSVLRNPAGIDQGVFWLFHPDRFAP